MGRTMEGHLMLSLRHIHDLRSPVYRVDAIVDLFQPRFVEDERPSKLHEWQKLEQMPLCQEDRLRRPTVRLQG